jgi:hypothetical protein
MVLLAFDTEANRFAEFGGVPNSLEICQSWKQLPRRLDNIPPICFKAGEEPIIECFGGEEVGDSSSSSEDEDEVDEEEDEELLDFARSLVSWISTLFEELFGESCLEILGTSKSLTTLSSETETTIAQAN